MVLLGLNTVRLVVQLSVDQHTTCQKESPQRPSCRGGFHLPLDSPRREAYGTRVGGVNAPREYGSKGGRVKEDGVQAQL
jgi:hypothetical protein